MSRLSDCCKAPVDVSTGDEETSCYVCTECGKACDQYVEVAPCPFCDSPLVYAEGGGYWYCPKDLSECPANSYEIIALPEPLAAHNEHYELVQAGKRANEFCDNPPEPLSGMSIQADIGWRRCAKTTRRILRGEKLPTFDDVKGIFKDKGSTDG